MVKLTSALHLFSAVLLGAGAGVCNPTQPSGDEQAAVAASAAAAGPAPGKIVELTSETFDETVFGSGRPVLVAFHAPWCEPCRELGPHLDELAESFGPAGAGAGVGGRVLIARLNADKHVDVATRNRVGVYPSVRLYTTAAAEGGGADAGADAGSEGAGAQPRAEMREYTGERTAEGIAEFVTRFTGVEPGPVGLSSKVMAMDDDSFGVTVGGKKHVLVSFTTPWCKHCKKLSPTWKRLAEIYADDRSVLIAKVNADSPASRQVAAQQKIKSYPTIKFFPRGSTDGIVYEGSRSEEALVRFISQNAGAETRPAAKGEPKNLHKSISTIEAVVDEADAVAKQAKKKDGKPSSKFYSRITNRIRANAEYLKEQIRKLTHWSTYRRKSGKSGKPKRSAE